LRFRNIPYKPIASSPRKSPTGMIPFVVEDGNTLTDSQEIIEHFEQRQPRHLDEGLTNEQRAQAFFIRNLIEDRLYWQVTFMRWGDPQGWALFRPDLLKSFPRLMRWLPLVIRYRLLKQMRRRGLKSEDTEAAYDKGRAVVLSLAEFLGDKDYMLGESLRSLDISVYAFLANILDQRYSNPLQVYLKSMDNLVAYCGRIKAVTFADWTPPSK
jgi:glutathione S-transferase